MPIAAPLLACVLPLLALGCAAEGPEEAAAAMRDALASARASLAMAGAPPPAAVPPGGAAVPPGDAAARPAPPALPAALPQPGAPRARGAAPPGTAESLAGARAEDLRRMLGEPSLRRPEGDAEIWLYEAPSCRLDVILYTRAGALVVAHAAARALAEGGAVTEAACLSAIAAAPATAPWPGTGRRA